MMDIAVARASDEELAARFVAEAVPLFDVLARHARRLTRSECDAEDLLQDTLLHAFGGFRSFREGTNLNAWLFRILHNRWVSRHRHRECRPSEVPLDVLLGGVAPVGQATRRSAELEVLDGMPDGDVEAAFAALPEAIRTALYYVDVRGHTHAETAALMNVPMGTVMSRVSRGRQRLRVALSHLDHAPGEFGVARRRTA